MTSIPDGTFQIFSADLKVGHLDISLIAPSIFPPYFFVIGSHRKDLNEQFKVISDASTGLYKIYSTSRPKAAFHVQGGLIVLSEAEGAADSFSIEPAGEGVYKIHVPNEDLVATIENAGEDVLRVAPANGTDSQLFSFGK